jgi:hypothetical protein
VRLIICGLLLSFLSVNSNAEKISTLKTNVLNLTCSISFSGFAEMPDTSITKNATLSAGKNAKGGAVLLTQTDAFEFWLMAHGVQTLGGDRFINNFQVAIKDKKSEFFAHALSDTSYSATQPPKAARLSFVEYYPSSLLERGELILECLADQ